MKNSMEQYHICSKEEMQRIDQLDIRLSRMFGYPRHAEFGIRLEGREGYDETFAYIYSCKVSELADVDDRQTPLPAGKCLLFLTRSDIEKLLQDNVGAVELIFSEDTLYILNHYFYDPTVLE